MGCPWRCADAESGNLDISSSTHLHDARLQSYNGHIHGARELPAFLCVSSHAARQFNLLFCAPASVKWFWFQQIPGCSVDGLPGAISNQPTLDIILIGLRRRYSRGFSSISVVLLPISFG